MLREIATNESGEVLWDRPYPFKALSAVGEFLVDNWISYVVVSSKLDGEIVQTVLKLSERGRASMQSARMD